MKRFIYASLILLLVSFSTIAQTEESKDKTECPKLELNISSSYAGAGDSLIFTLGLNAGFDIDDFKITWSLDKGTIVEGKGTPIVFVNANDIESQTLTATAVVTNGKNCSATASKITDKYVGNSIVFAESNSIDTADFGLQHLLGELSRKPLSVGYVVNYGTKAESMERENLFRNLLLKNNLTEDRIKFIYGGKRNEEFTRVWLNYPPTICPELTVTGPPYIVKPGEMMTFVATVFGGRSKRIEYDWSVDKGEIISGQKTNAITVKTPNDDVTPTATVTIRTDNSCVLSGSETGAVCSCGPEPILIDEFGRISNGDLRQRMDSFLVELMNNPDSQGYIINYGSKKEITQRERQFRNHFNLREFELSRIVFMDGGREKEIRTRFWRIPAGADASTID